MKKAAKFFIVFICAAILFCGSLRGFAHAAAGSVKISTGSEVAVGNTISVAVTFSASDIWGVEAYLTYNTSVLKYVSCADGNVVRSGTVMLVLDSDGTSTVRTTIKFTVLKAGSCPLKITSSKIYNGSFEQIGTPTTSLNLTAAPAVPVDTTPPGLKTAIKVDYRDSELYMWTDLDGVSLPSGFVLSSELFGDTKIETAYSDKQDLSLAYASDKTGKTGAFYILEDSALYRFVQLDSAQQSYAVVREPTVSAPYGYIRTVYVLSDGEQLPAWQLISGDYPEMYLMYLIDGKGDSDFYLFNSKDGTYQRYVDLGIHEPDPVEPDEEGDKTLGDVLLRIFEDENVCYVVVTLVMIICLSLTAVVVCADALYKSKRTIAALNPQTDFEAFSDEEQPSAPEAEDVSEAEDGEQRPSAEKSDLAEADEVAPDTGIAPENDGETGEKPDLSAETAEEPVKKKPFAWLRRKREQPLIGAHAMNAVPVPDLGTIMTASIAAEASTVEKNTEKQKTAEAPTAERNGEKQKTVEVATAERNGEKQKTVEVATAERNGEKQKATEVATAERNGEKQKPAAIATVEKCGETKTAIGEAAVVGDVDEQGNAENFPETEEKPAEKRGLFGWLRRKKRTTESADLSVDGEIAPETDPDSRASVPTEKESEPTTGATVNKKHPAPDEKITAKKSPITAENKAPVQKTPDAMENKAQLKKSPVTTENEASAQKATSVAGAKALAKKSPATTENKAPVQKTPDTSENKAQLKNSPVIAANEALTKKDETQVADKKKSSLTASAVVQELPPDGEIAYEYTAPYSVRDTARFLFNSDEGLPRESVAEIPSLPAFDAKLAQENRLSQILDRYKSKDKKDE